MRSRTIVLVALFVLVDVGVLAAAYAMTHRAPPTEGDVAAAAPADPQASSSRATPDWTGPLYLAASPSGRLARVTRGSCDTREPVRSRVWVASRFRSPLREVRVPGLQESLGVAMDDDVVRIVGTGPTCALAGFVSRDGGATWRTGTVPRDVWYLDRDTTQSVIHGPVDRGEQNVDCVPNAVSTIRDGAAAVISCQDGNVMVISAKRGDDLRTYQVSEPASGALLPTGAAPIALATSDDCTSALVLTNLQRAPRELACLGQDDAPLGLATSGARIFAQVGYRLVLSADAGKHFDRYPGDAPGAR